MNRIAAALAIAFACLFATPVLADSLTCFVGDANDTLKTWLEKSGQTAILSMDISTGADQTLPGMVTVDTATGKFSIMVRVNGQTCMLAVGVNMHPAGTPPPDAKPQGFDQAPVLVAPGVRLYQVHDWYLGLHNEDGQLCCGGVDCGPVRDDEVTPVPGGYEVHVRDFSPLGISKGRIDAFVSNMRAKPAKEGGEYHLCFWGGEVKCFFFPAPSY